MSIKYSLSPNSLVTTDTVYRALIHPTQVVHEDDIYERMSRGGTSLGKGEIMACMQLYNATLEEYLKEGCFINTRHGNYKPGIKGNFESPTESFSVAKHHKHVNISASVTLEEAIAEAHVERVTGEVVAPQPLELLDSKSNTVNKELTPSSMGKLTGSRLHFDAINPPEGLYFIAADGAETKVTEVLDNTDSKVYFVIPASLTAGTYHLEVRAAYTQSDQLRTGQLAAILTVQ